MRSFCPSVLGTVEEKFELLCCLLSDAYDQKTQCLQALQNITLLLLVQHWSRADVVKFHCNSNVGKTEFEVVK